MTHSILITMDMISDRSHIHEHPIDLSFIKSDSLKDTKR